MVTFPAGVGSKWDSSLTLTEPERALTGVRVENQTHTVEIRHRVYCPHCPLSGIGQFGLRRMQRIDETLSAITGTKSTDLELARRVLTLSDDNSRITMEIVLVENRRLVEPLLAARSQNSKNITELIEEGESRCKSEKEAQLLSEVQKTRKAYLEGSQRAIHLLIDERKHDEAERVMVNETLPELRKYHAAWERFVEFQKEELDEAVKQAQDETPRPVALLRY